jgi:hypothetical protein
MPNASRVLPALAVTSLLIVACSGSGDSGTASNPVTKQTVEAVASIVCDKIEECTSPFIMQTVFGGSSTCKARQAAQLDLEVHGNGYVGTETEAQACKNAMAAAPCKNIFAGIPLKECEVPGSLPDNAPCVGNGQCASRVCFVDDAATCGTCGTKAAEGGDCTSARCGDGLECGGKKKCVKPGAEGAACGGAQDPPCETLLLCGEGKCQRGLAKGAVCKLGETDVPCDYFKGLVCIPTSETEGKCEDIIVAAVGEACGVVATEPFKYAECGNGQCVKDKCVAQLADGASCTTDGEPGCQEPAKCRNGKCALRDPLVCK